MSKEIKEMLNDEIGKTFGKLESLSTETEERKSAISELETLYKLSIDEKKLELEAEANSFS